MFRLIKEGICDKSSVPSVSAISRLLRGRDEEEVKKSSKWTPGIQFRGGYMRGLGAGVLLWPHFTYVYLPLQQDGGKFILIAKIYRAVQKHF